MTQLAWQIAHSNELAKPPERPNRAYCIYFSLDDNATEVIPRVVAMDQNIDINIVKAPRKYEDDLRGMTRRNEGIKRLKRSVDKFKIIDSNHGTSIEKIEEQIKRHEIQLKSIDETYKLVVFIDNFHDITVDSIKFGDNENAKFDYITNELSRICTNFDIPIVCTAEFRKLNGLRRPTVDDVRSAAKIAYEAKAILLCYNEVGIRGDSASIYYMREDIPYKQPILEVKVGKNKYTSYKNRMFFEFFPHMSKLNPVLEEEAKRYNQMIVS